MIKKTKKLLSTSELAKLLGISRVAVWRKIKKGQIKATQVGRNFVIDSGILNEELTPEEKKEIEQAVKKTVKEYAETLKLLGAT